MKDAPGVGAVIVCVTVTTWPFSSEVDSVWHVLDHWPLSTTIQPEAPAMLSLDALPQHARRSEALKESCFHPHGVLVALAVGVRSYQ